MSSTAAPRRRLALLLVAVLAAALGGVATQTATAGPPSGPTQPSVIDRVYSPGVAAPSGLPTGAAPYVIVEAGWHASPSR